MPSPVLRESYLRLRTAFRLALPIAVFALAGCKSEPLSTPVGSSIPRDTQVNVANTEVIVGPNRLLLGIVDGSGTPIGKAAVHLRFFADSSPSRTPSSEADAMYLGEGTATASGLYSARASFDKPGTWRLEALITRASQKPVPVTSRFNVQANSFTPAPGQPSIASKNLTLVEPPIEQLTSQRPTGDPDFYKLSIADAVKAEKPFVIIFSTPAFCQTQTCGPQLEAAQALKKQYGARMNFIHVEVYQRPDLLLTGEHRPQLNPVVTEWKLATEPYTFLVDKAGKIFDRLEGYSSEEELKASIDRLLTL